MARTPNIPANPGPSREDEVLIREIDEAVREDALMTFLRVHGVKVLAVILAGIAALGAWLVYDHFAEQKLEQQSEALISGLDAAAAGDFKTAGEKVAPLTAEGNSDGARAAARFIQAAAAIEAGDTAKASGIYDAIVKDAGTPKALRDLATIRQVSLDYDRMKPADVIARLSPLAEPGSPWFGSAGELVAMAHVENGNRAAAGKIFAGIAKDESQPETLRSRARQMAGLMGVDAVVDVRKLLKDEGVSTEAAAAGAGRPAAAE
ncbi:tetratricopeptide repeat protein [Erythrobacter sp. WG]|uniref:tetratricopeptide repeat protein n=1 Tax=Erythrobacter sp. WG TaxID=2985510 RepID=UPI00226EDDB8|nr:tetratricopeptide repeat protein [Erythrobacter sp. WG]MCX9148582.1 tetratricopeptide repeat protein [Erythrobacter sp. WG]